MTGSLADRFAALRGEQRVALLRRIVQAGRLDEIPDVVPRRDGDGPVRPSPAQEDLWVYESLYPDQGALNLCCAYHFDGPVDPTELERALTAVQQRHDVLRMRISGDAGNLRADFPPAPPFRLERVDLGGGAGALDDALAAFARRPFDLARDQLIRGVLVTVDANRSTLALALHHMVTDWWSFDVLHTEFAEAYQAIRAGRSPRREPGRIQYADFASWQRELEAAGVFEAQLAFWRGYLADLPAPISVGSRRTGRPAASTVDGQPDAGHGVEQVRFRLDAPAAAAVREFARQHGATVYGVLMTAFAVLVHRLSGRADFVVGTPIANRAATGLDRLIGYVMNAVPTRWRIGTADTFAGLLARFVAEFPRILTHADVPVGRIVRDLAPQRVSGRSPLYQWVFMYLPTQGSIRALREFAEPQRVPTGGEHDVVAAVQDVEGGMAGSLDFRADAYPPEVMARWGTAFTTLLAGLLAEPGAPVGSVPMLDAAERHRLLVDLNDTACDIPVTSLADLVAGAAAATPHAPALRSPDLSLDYAGLIEHADRLAAVLAPWLPAGAGRAAPGRAGSGGAGSGGAGSGTADPRRTGGEPVVAIALPRCAALVVAVLAVQRAGAAYLPIDPSLPADRIRYLLDDAAPVLVLTDAAAPVGLPDTGIPRLPVDGAGRASSPPASPPSEPALASGPAPASEPTSPSGPAPASEPVSPSGPAPVPASEPSPSERSASVSSVSPSASASAPAAGQPATTGYVMYTSGSTGRPKGVVVGHAGIGGLAHTLVSRLGLGPRDRILQLGSPGFDIWVGELCMAFGAGGTLVVPPPGPLAGAALADVLRRERVTGTLIPPAVLSSVPPGDFPDLRVLCVGGDVLPPALVATWAAPGRRIVNAYGPTEATVAATLSDALAGDGGAPIGRPVDNGRTYVLDSRLCPVPVGVAGELYLAGNGLAHGYLGRPGATAERFVADPYAARPGGRMYRTGDLVRWREDGQLDFLGRTDDQIALRGFRVEPGEIEAVLAGHESVAQAVVLLREDVPGQHQLVAYLVPRSGRRVEPDQIAAHARAALPRHMVPAAFVPLPELPTTAHGKLDRAALPPPAGPSPSARAPRTDRERALCGLFAEVLGAERVGVDDGFFELGGDSIMAIQLVSRARTAGLELTMEEIFDARTPAALATLARATPARGTPARGTAAPAAASPREGTDDRGEGRFPPTPMVHWWREQGGPLDRFTMSMLLPTPAGIDETAVAAALRALTDRHGALRLRLLRHGPQDWELEVPPAGAGAARLVRVDGAGLSDGQIRERAADAAAGTRLSPETGPVLAAVWFDRGSAEGRLLITVHHLAVDGVSWHLLREDLAGLLASGAAPGPAPATSYRRWSQLLHERAGQMADRLPSWEAILRGPQARLAPQRRPGSRRVSLTVELPADRTAPVLTRVPAAFRCGPNDVLLTALLAAALRWRGDGDALLVDLEGHGREATTGELDLSRTVGWFTSQYPVRLEAAEAGAPFWTGGTAAGRALKRVKEQLRAVPDGGLSYGLLRYLNPDTAPKLAELPGPDLRFNYLGRFDGAGTGEVELLGAAAQDAVPLTHAVELDAVSEVRADGPHLVANWSYPAGTMTEPEVRALAGYWFAALDVLAEHAGKQGAGGATASDFPLVELTQDQIDALQADLGDLDDLADPGDLAGDADEPDEPAGAVDGFDAMDGFGAMDMSGGLDAAGGLDGFDAMGGPAAPTGTLPGLDGDPDAPGGPVRDGRR